MQVRGSVVVPSFLLQKLGRNFLRSCRAVQNCFLGISESAVEMGCAAGCANSNVHEPDEPELKGSKGHITMAPMGPMGLMGPKGPKGPRPKTSGVQQHKMHHIKHKQQRKADLVELESKTSKSMMAEDPPFRSMFEGWFHSWC